MKCVKCESEMRQFRKDLKMTEYVCTRCGDALMVPGTDALPASAVDPAHYRSHPSGVECIEITKHMNFCLGNAVKYIWRAGLKGEALEDLKKAAWYIKCEIERLEKTK